MRILRRMTLALTLGATVATSACVTDSPVGVGRASEAAVGGLGGGVLGGYLLGDIVGGRRARTAKIVEAGIGGTAGIEIGAYMDKQERALRAGTAGTGVQLVRQGDDVILTIPLGLTFEYKSDAVAPAFRPTLDQLASVLGQYDRSYVDVYAHTDAIGSGGYNQRLSERRAGAVAAYLVSRGVNAARLGTHGFGKAQPIASNETEDGRAANRRVEIKIVPIAQIELR